MKAYQTLKPEKWPDVADLVADGKIGRNKKKVRRTLKRIDKARASKAWKKEAAASV